MGTEGRERTGGPAAKHRADLLAEEEGFLSMQGCVRTLRSLMSFFPPRPAVGGTRSPQQEEPSPHQLWVVPLFVQHPTVLSGTRVRVDTQRARFESIRTETDETWPGAKKATRAELHALIRLVYSF